MPLEDGLRDARQSGDNLARNSWTTLLHKSWKTLLQDTGARGLCETLLKDIEKGDFCKNELGYGGLRWARLGMLREMT